MTASDRNIVLVSIDSLRGDHCGASGGYQGLTPTMNALAKEGVNFENAVAPGPQTFSSMPAVFTGRQRPPTTLDEYPQDSHWGRRLAPIEDHIRRFESLAERLQRWGYETAGVSPNPWTSTATGFDRGFDHFVDFSEGGTDGILHAIAERIPGVDTDSRQVTLALNLLSGSEFFSQWETLYGEIQQTRARLTEPYFLWVFILDTHYPFVAARPHRREQSLLGTYTSAYRSSGAMRGNSDGMSEAVRESVKRSYRDTVRASDAFLERLHADLSEDDPVFVVHSDHGESFGDHGNYGHHHREVYEENVHVPYFVHNAGVNATVSDPTSLSTIYDTVLDIARDGTFDPAAVGTPFAIASSECGTNRTVRGRRFKYMESDDEKLLFDLKSDPGERTDVSRAYPEVCKILETELRRFDGHVDEIERIHRASSTLAASHGL